MATTLPLIGPDKVPKTHDLNLIIDVKDAGVARDLTDAEIKCVISSYGAQKFLASTTNGRITVLDPLSGRAYLRITLAELLTIPSGVHRYYVVYINGGVTEALIEESQIEIV